MNNGDVCMYWHDTNLSVCLPVPVVSVVVLPVVVVMAMAGDGIYIYIRSRRYKDDSRDGRAGRVQVGRGISFKIDRCMHRTPGFQNRIMHI